MRTILKMLIHRKTGKKIAVKDLETDFHTEFGVISKTALSSEKEIIKSSKGEEFLFLEPMFADLLKQLQRGPQIIVQKDIGMIIAKTGIGRESKAVDAGGGTGMLCFSLANICKEVAAYESNPKHYAILEKNKKILSLKNIILKRKDIYQGIDETKIDLLTLDLPEPWKALPAAEEALKNGAFLVAYFPNLLQVKTFIDETKKTNVAVQEIIELLERKWKIEEKIMRPEFQMLGHTGFLIFCRKK